MELLTNRLVMLVEQVAENQMADLINKEKIQKQRISERSQRETMLSFELQAAENQARRSKKSSNLATLQRSALTRSAFGGSILQRQAVKDKDQDKDGNNTTKITTVCDIWGLSKKVKEAKEGMNKTSKKDDPNDIGDGNQPKINVSKFRKAAKLTVLLESMKEGKAVCTCENLDARCKLHDT